MRSIALSGSSVYWPFSSTGSKSDKSRSNGSAIVHIREAEEEEEDRPAGARDQRKTRHSALLRYRLLQREVEQEQEEADGEEEEWLQGISQASRRSSVEWDSDEATASLTIKQQQLPSSISPVPSLSPSRPRLFDDDSDDDAGDCFVLPRTPGSPSPSPPPSILGRRRSLSRRSPSRKPTTTDPLLSPPAHSPAFLAQGNSSGWLPTPSTTPRRRLSSSFSSSFELVSPASSSPSSSSASPATRPISLLTKSLRSLARLPNLSLDDDDDAAAPSKSASALDLEGLEVVVNEAPWGGAGLSAIDEAWEVPTRRGEKDIRIPPPILMPDHHTVAVQLQTFSTPHHRPQVTPPPSPPRGGKSMDLFPPPPPPSPVVVELPCTSDVLPPPPPPLTTTTTTRYISNPAHLLMISLELSMMRADKIRSPLRPRAVVIRYTTTTTTSNMGVNDEESGVVAAEASKKGSGLRWEVGKDQ